MGNHINTTRPIEECPLFRFRRGATYTARGLGPDDYTYSGGPRDTAASRSGFVISRDTGMVMTAHLHKKVGYKITDSPSTNGALIGLLRDITGDDRLCVYPEHDSQDWIIMLDTQRVYSLRVHRRTEYEAIVAAFWALHDAGVTHG